MYTPTSPIPPGTSLSFGIKAVMAYNSNVVDDCQYPPTPPCDYYGVITYVSASSTDARDTGGEVINLNVNPDGVALSLDLSDSLGGGGSAPAGTGFNYLANVSIGEDVSGAPPETQPVTLTDALPAGTVLTAEPSGAGWDCSASVVTTSTVSCTYTPPVGGIPQGAALPTLVEPARLTDGTVGDSLTNTAAASSADTGGATASDVVTVSPTAGFVTGGGWITSPVGACLDTTVCSAAAGKGTFGFVSRYAKGATAPSGNVEYAVHDGGLNFSSSSYRWLVVDHAGNSAEFEGNGNVNGMNGYTFMIWLTAGPQATFRIQISNTASGRAIYDTGPQSLGGGAIMLHSP